VLENFSFDKPKTKEFAGILKNLALTGKRTLVVVPEVNNNLVLSSRNIERSKVVPAAELNTYDIMNASSIVFVEGSIQKVESTLLNN
jgi:large subunit ribosomal protein L4